MISAFQPHSKSGRGQPHSKTLPRYPDAQEVAKLLECGCPLPLFRVRYEHPNLVAHKRTQNEVQRPALAFIPRPLVPSCLGGSTMTHVTPRTRKGLFRPLFFGIFFRPCNKSI
jgi:hypothetical protein